MSHLLAFIGISLTVICTPGPDTALIVRNTLLGGRRNGIRTVAGVVTGLTAWAVAAAAGIAAVVAASYPLFVAIRTAGALYLVWLGIGALRAAMRRHDPPEVRIRQFGNGYRQGLLSNLGNPKVAIFFTSLLPQFGTGFAGHLGLGLLFVAMGSVWLTSYTVAVTRAQRWLLRTRVRRVMDAVTGSVLVAFGVRLATERG
jgi:threonine/homoserine/homoserine lactone efflux protein